MSSAYGAASAEEFTAEDFATLAEEYATAEEYAAAEYAAAEYAKEREYAKVKEGRSDTLGPEMWAGVCGVEGMKGGEKMGARKRAEEKMGARKRAEEYGRVIGVRV
ncbi:hypothetical protein LTR50_007793 [Elasticomyces elasticus]|nr:hypothetical protein LTR50_007793 [Elasticomyces elasticus]